MSGSISIGGDFADRLLLALTRDDSSSAARPAAGAGSFADARQTSVFLSTKEDSGAPGRLRGMLSTGFGTIARLMGATGGDAPRDQKQDEAAARAEIRQTLPLARAALQATEGGLRGLMDKWDISPYFRGGAPAGLTDILDESDGISTRQLASRLDQNPGYHTIIQRLLQAANIYVMIVLSGNMVPANERMTVNGITRAKSDFEMLGKFLTSFRDATDYLAVLTSALYALHPIKEESDGNWTKILILTKWALQDLERLYNTHLAILSLIEINLEKNRSAVQKYTADLHSLGTIGGIIAQARSLSFNTAEGTGVDVVLHSEVPELNIPDGMQIPILAILHSMVDNGIKYSQPSRHGSDAAVEISTSLGKRGLTIDVADNGVGIKNIQDAMSGRRLRPDLAPGLGRSLRNSHAIAMRHGIVLDYHPMTNWTGVMNAGSRFSLRVGVQSNEGTVPCAYPIYPQSSSLGGTMPGAAASAMAGGIGMMLPGFPLALRPL